jgi:tetratricopeptide (TPR) repeat protein
MKKQPPVRKNEKRTPASARKLAPAPLRWTKPEPFVPSPFPNWIYVVIVAFSFAIYSNTMWNEFALDDTMVLTQNEFVKSGVSGIPKIFKYDTFIGRYGEQVTNLPGGRYRPLSVALLALEYDIFVNSDVKQIIRDRLDESKTQYNVPRQYIVPDMQARIVDTTQAGFVVVSKPSPKQNEDDAPLYMKTMLPYASHFVNMLLYAITACFVFKLLLRLFPVRDTSGWKRLLNVPVIATLLFVAHPVHVEAVANIKGRDEIMTFLGALMALFYTLRWLDTRDRKYMLITFLCFLAGAFSKENAITFLAIIPLTVYFCTSYRLKDNFVALLPSLAAALVFLMVRGSVITWSPMPETELMNNPFLGMRPFEKWGSIIYVLGRYLWLLIFPHPLTTDYYPYHIPKVTMTGSDPNSAINAIGIGNILIWGALLLYIALFVFILWGMAPHRRNKYAYAVAWYLIPMSVVSNVFVMIGTSMNERFVFISSVGFCLAVALFLVHHLPRLLKNAKLYQPLLAGFLAVVLCFYSIQSIARNKVWFDDFTLSTTDAKLSPKSAKANYDAARVYNIKFQSAPNDSLRLFYTKQIYYYSKRAIAIHPVYENALLLYSWSNSMLGNHPDSLAKYPRRASIEALKQLLRRNPLTPFAFDPLVPLIAQLPTTEERVKEWEAVYALSPERFESNYNLACVYAKDQGLNRTTGQFNREQLLKAIPYFERTVTLKPDFINGLIDLGAMYGNTGNPVKAVEIFEKAVKTAPNDTLAWKNLGQTYLTLGDQSKAMQAQQQYWRIKSGGQ